MLPPRIVFLASIVPNKGPSGGLVLITVQFSLVVMPLCVTAMQNSYFVFGNKCEAVYERMYGQIFTTV